MSGYDVTIVRRMIFVLLGVLFLEFPGETFSRAVQLTENQKLAEETKVSIRQKLIPLLDQYCGDACLVIRIDTDILERIPENNDLGFESLTDEQIRYEYDIGQVIIHIQVDQQVTQMNREKLATILNYHLREFSVATKINWVTVALPKIGASASALVRLKEKMKRMVEESVHQVIEKYCPDGCILSDIEVRGFLVTPDEAELLTAREVLTEESTHSTMKIDEVAVNLSLDEKISGEVRKNILALMRAKTHFIRPIVFRVSTVEFPESWEDKQRRKSSESDDPYGLEKLRHMLTLFRDLAGTREIISKTESRNSSSNTSESEFSGSSKEQSENSWFWPALIFVILIIIVLTGALRFVQAGKDARVMMQAMYDQEGESAHAVNKNASHTNHHVEKTKEIREQMELQSLHDELIDVFVNHPKVARETFGRLLQEEGVEEAAKYVYIFGKVIVFELLSDISMQRSLYELSEYYHKSNIQLTREEKLILLEKLRRKVTANEIRVMTSQRIDQFDFIERLDVNQLFALMKDEAPQVQSIILTQVSRKRRKLVFEMFEGRAKINLMNELCKADAIPREYLYNVAIALSKKVLSRPEFDTHSLRSSDIIIELMERATLREQKVLMKNLMETNTEAARSIKIRLVTIELLPYLKGGHLLEMVLGLDSSELLTFLGGCPDHIQKLLLSNAPEELAESWREELDVQGTIEESNYRLVEMKILQKIRQLSANGAINLLEMNEMIFANLDGIDTEEGEMQDMSDAAQVLA